MESNLVYTLSLNQDEFYQVKAALQCLEDVIYIGDYSNRSKQLDELSLLMKKFDAIANKTEKGS